MENILHGSSPDEQRSRSGKSGQPGGLISGGRMAALLLSHRALWPCSFVAPCQLPARNQRAHCLFMRWVLTVHPQTRCTNQYPPASDTITEHAGAERRVNCGARFHFKISGSTSDAMASWPVSTPRLNERSGN